MFIRLFLSFVVKLQMNHIYYEAGGRWMKGESMTLKGVKVVVTCLIYSFHLYYSYSNDIKPQT